MAIRHHVGMANTPGQIFFFKSNDNRNEGWEGRDSGETQSRLVRLKTDIRSQEKKQQYRTHQMPYLPLKILREIISRCARPARNTTYQLHRQQNECCGFETYKFHELNRSSDENWH